MKKFILFFILALFFSLGELSAVDEVEIAQLISQLGDTDYDKRIQATKKLKEIGEPAKSALERALSASDPEIRMRAKEILADIKLGIRPSWPEDLVKKVRGFGKLKTDAKKKLIAEMVEFSEKEAMPFLFSMLENNNKTDAVIALTALKSLKNKEALYRKILQLFNEKEPDNEYQAELFAKAGIETRDFGIIRKALKNPHLPKKMKRDIVKNQIAILEELLDEKNLEKVVERSEELSESLPNDAKILYIQAEALTQLQRKDEAEKAALKALSLNPESESPHYTMGEYLMKAGKLRLSEKEWERILEIPPVDGVYDINAYLRLSDIYEKNKLYIKALEYLEIGVKKYKIAKDKHGSGMGMIGADQLDQKIAYLRKKASKEGNAGDAIKDNPPKKKNYVKFNLHISEKNGKYDEMQKELKTIQGSIAFGVKPYGIGLLKKKIVKMKYNNDKKEFAVTLNNSPCAKPQKMEIHTQTAKVAVFELDTCNIYRITPEKEKVELLKSYDKEYKLRIQQGDLIKNWKDIIFKCNGKEYSWEKLNKGIPYDYLPEKLNIEIKGIAPSGKKEEIKFTVESGKMN